MYVYISIYIYIYIYTYPPCVGTILAFKAAYTSSLRPHTIAAQGLIQ